MAKTVEYAYRRDHIRKTSWSTKAIKFVFRGPVIETKYCWIM